MEGSSLHQYSLECEPGVGWRMKLVHYMSSLAIKVVKKCTEKRGRMHCGHELLKFVKNQTFYFLAILTLPSEGRLFLQLTVVL